MQWRITVRSGEGFSPQCQQARSGDAVFWFNADENVTHHPISSDPVAKWSIPPIPGGNTSGLLNVNAGATVEYYCEYHPEETGTIVVATGIPIAFGADPLFGETGIVAKQCVAWANSDDKPHQPCPDSGDPWFEGPIESGDISSTVSFDAAGSYTYHCALHPNETGTIKVS
jgi:plastocyanin